MFIEAQMLGHMASELDEAARNKDGIGALGLHGRNQRFSARPEGDPLPQDPADGVLRQILYQRQTRFERRLEIEFTLHGAGGDHLDPVANAGKRTQLVDAFLADHGRVHVGDEEALAAVIRGQERNIDRLILDQAADLGALAG